MIYVSFDIYIQALGEGYIVGMIASMIVFLGVNYYARRYAHRDGYDVKDLAAAAILWPLAWGVLAFPEHDTMGLHRWDDA